MLYGIGLIYALIWLVRRREAVSQSLISLTEIALAFHLVSLVESFRFNGRLVLTTMHQVESLLAFLMMLFFIGVFYAYKTSSPSVFVFPAVFLLTLSAAVAQQPPQFSSPFLRSGWIFFHIALIFAGYAALFFSFVASILYLLQERKLKSKQVGGILAKLPSLETIDDLGYRSLLLGFPFMTLGLIAGSVMAQVEFGPAFFHDPKVLLSLLMWGVYLVMLYTRLSIGWRGRRAAFLSAFAFAAAVSAWVANYFSSMHRFISQ
ncbi:MAG TPA: cytochrome c biogenesis protein CcsA [Terriglobales bacterium]